MEITDEMHYKIKSIWDKGIDEGYTGRLFCRNNALIQIANVIGKNYKMMNKQERKNFRFDVISGYQMGFFQKRQEY